MPGSTEACPRPVVINLVRTFSKALLGLTGTGAEQVSGCVCPSKGLPVEQHNLSDS